MASNEKQTPSNSAIKSTQNSNTNHCASCDAPNCTMRCSLCHITYYCSRTCQVQDWKSQHSKTCINNKKNKKKLKSKKKNSKNSKRKKMTNHDDRFLNFLSNKQRDKENQEEKKTASFESLSPRDQIGHKLIQLIETNETDKFFKVLEKCKNDKQVYNYLIHNYRSQDDDKKSLIVAACEYNNNKIADFLINLKGININCSDKYGRTPFYWSSVNDNINMAIKIGEKGGNPNVISSKEGFTTLMFICQNGNTKMIQVLIKYGFDFSVTSSGLSDCICVFSFFMHWELVHIVYFVWILDFDHFFIIDFVVVTSLAVAAQNGHLDCIKLLFDIEEEILFKNKSNKKKNGKEKIIDLSQKVKQNSILDMACFNNHMNVVRYLIEEQGLLQVKIKKLVNKKEMLVSIINDTNCLGNTPFGTAASCGHKEMLDLLYKLCKEKNIDFDLNKYESGSMAPIHRAVEKNHWQCVEWFVNNTQENECDCNLKINRGKGYAGITPLGTAIVMGSDKSVEILCDAAGKRVNIEIDLIHNFDRAILQSNVKIMKILLSTLMNHSQKTFIIDELFVNQMIRTQTKNSSSESSSTLAMIDFLQQLKDIVTTQNKDLLELILLNDINNNASKQQILVKLQRCQKILSIASNLKRFCGDDVKEFASKLIGIINKMVSNQVLVNDTLLMLSREFDIESFETCLKNSISKCISIDSKNKIYHAKDVVWYKNCILQSNVLCLPAAVKEKSQECEAVKDNGKRNVTGKLEKPAKPEKGKDKEDEKEKEKEKEVTIKTAIKSPVRSTNINCNKIPLLFDTVVRDVIEKELDKQRVFIRDEIGKMKDLDADSWDNLLKYQAFNRDINNVLSQQDVTIEQVNIMNSKGLQAKYSEKDLINDPITGFNGAAEYDNNGYLTDLIIAANKLNPQFQRDCRRLLSSKMLGVECVFSEAPIKTKERCKIKAAVDYSDREWPHTCNILDIIRCSVSFNTAKDLITGLDKFRAMVGAIERAYISIDTGCLGQIVRIKNMFSSIKQWNEKDLTEYSYCDIKCNIFVSNSQFSMIAEVQFILDFMISAKKLGHVFYSIVRNDDLYREIWRNIASSSNYGSNSSNDNIKEKGNENKHRETKIRDIKSIIVRKDYHALTHLVFYGNLESIVKKLNIDTNQLLESCQMNKWMKGYRLIKCSLPNSGLNINLNPNSIPIRKQRDNEKKQNKETNERHEKREKKEKKEKKARDKESNVELESHSSGKIVVRIQGGIVDFNSMPQQSQGLVLLQLIANKDFDQFKSIIDRISKNQRKYLLSQVKHDGYTIPLFCANSGDDNLELLRFMLDKHFDDININATHQFGANLLYYACESNLLDIIELLFEKSEKDKDGKSKLNVNVIFKADVIKNITPMWYACYHGNLRLIKLLMKHGFDFENNINYKKMPEGFSTLHICCQTGNLECLKYLIWVDKTQFGGNTIDYYAKTTQGMNALFVAVNTGHTHIVEYLVKDMQYLEGKVNGKLLFDINNTDEILVSGAGFNMIHTVAQSGFVSILKLLHKYSIKSGNPIDYTVKEKKNGCNILYMACNSANHTAAECVRFLLDVTRSNNQDIGLNEQDTVDRQHFTPLMIACKHGNLSAVKCLLEMSEIKILDILDDNGHNALDIATIHGKTQILQLLLGKLIDKYNITDLDRLSKINIINGRIVSKWIDMAQTHAKLQCRDQTVGKIFTLMQKLNMDVKSKDNDETINFLNQIKLNVFDKTNDDNKNENKFEWFKARLDFGVNTNAVLQENIEREYEAMKRILHITEMLDHFGCITTNNKNNGVLIKLARIINNMIKEKQPVNDTLIMIAYKYDSVNFGKILEATIKECIGVKQDLTRITDNERDIAWFKECIATSKVFALPAIESKYKTLFDQINNNIISKELLKQQNLIHRKVIEYKEDEDWMRLINYHNYSFATGSLDETTIQQNLLISQYTQINFMEKNGGIQPKYKSTSLVTNYSTGFNARNEYDYHGYLNDLQIVASNINPIFQKECKLLFTSGKYINNKTCIYTSAPMKTRQRCQMKASIDYSDKSWPNTSCLLDLIRCSVVFKTPKDLMNGLNTLKTLIGFNEQQKGFGCLYKIVRIKNMFGNIKHWNNDITKCGYCDIKLNVLVKVPNYQHSLIGEIQLMLNWMLEAKKIGHSFYSLQRNDQLYHTLANKLNADKQLMQLSDVNSKNSKFECKTDNESTPSLLVNEKMNQLKSMIARQDYHSLSKEVLFGTLDKLKTNTSVNFKELIHLCLQAKWNKGCKLLQSVIES